MIEVYKTNVKTRQQANKVIRSLKWNFWETRINFDLEDCDKVLRVEGIKPTDTIKVINVLIRLGFKCEILS